MSSDSDHISKPLKRVRCRISDSSESSDDSIIARINRKRRNNNVFSDESSGEDSDVQKPGLARRHRKRVIKTDLFDESSNESGCSSRIVESDTSTEWESDWSSESIEDSEDEMIPAKPSKNVRQRKTKEAAVKSPRNSDSEESDGQAEKCPICLLSFRKQEIGTPSSCEHCFCLLCITEWSKNVNTCPVDRQEFTAIHVRTHLGGKIVKHIPVEPKNNSEEHIQEDPTYCEICRQCDREDRMLLCDGCDLGFHLECLTPPMHQVPIEEWFCPECSPNNQQNLAESVEIDFDEIPDLMAEARCLGVTYGRTRTGVSHEVEIMGRFQHMYRQRLIPRTRQSERVRANIRADRNRAREELTTTVTTRTIPNFDPEQPSTSSGIDSISENSRGRSPNHLQPPLSNAKRTASNKTKRSKATSRKKKSRKMNKKGDTILREVRIREYNTDGEEEEIVTYVKVKPQTARRKYKKRAIKRRKKRKSQSTRRSRYCRVGSSARVTNTKTVRNRLALALGLARRPRGSTSTISLAPPNLKSSMPISNRSNLTNARFRAGISQVNLFGSNLMLDYTPLGSDDETNEDNSFDGGSIVTVQRRNSAICTNRRRLALKGISNTIHRDESRPIDDLIGSIINSQRLWHSKKKDITLKADGTLLLPTDNTDNEKNYETDKSMVNNNNQVSVNDNNIIINPVSENNLGTSTINSADIVQAPMYSHSRAGGVGNHNADGGGSFRGNYHDRNRGQGGQDYGMRDSYSGGGGRPNYGGPGPRDGFGHGDLRPPPAALDFSSNFDNRRRPPAPLMPHFRIRPHQNYRNDNNRRGRFNDMGRGGPLFRPNLSHGPSFPHPNNFQGSSNINMNDVPPPLIPPLMPPSMSQPELTSSAVEPEVDSVGNSSLLNESGADEISTVPQSERLEGEECDIYGDIETPNDKLTDDNAKCDENTETNVENGEESVAALLPPPVPPSDLLDYDDNSKSDKNNESDDEDLVIDDTPKDTANTETSENQIEDIYDPFAIADSDSNDSDARGMKSGAKIDESSHEIVAKLIDAENLSPPPLAPPPSPPDFLSIGDNMHDDNDDDDEEEDDAKGDDCPNFSIYSSETMDVARHTEQELSQQIGPLEPPPLPPDIPDDDDIIVADVQACDLSEIPEPSDPYVESLRKERQTLSKIPPKKISTDSRGKITFKIGNKFKLNNRLSSLYDELDDAVEISIAQEKQQDSGKVEQRGKQTICMSPSNMNTAKPDKNKDDNDDGKTNLDGGVENNVKDNNKVDEEPDDKEEDEEEEEEEEEEKEDRQSKEPNVLADELIHDRNSQDSDESDSPTILEKESSTLPASKSDDTVSISIPGTSREDEATNDATNIEVEQQDDDSIHQHSPESITEPDFQLQKDTVHCGASTNLDENNDNVDNWESDGAYTPCKDEMPVKEKRDDTEEHIGVSTFESGLEPITPPAKDRTSDDLDDGCRTPIEYAGLGTEAISETDEAINFEEDLTLSGLRKEKDMEDGEIMDENKLNSKKQSEKLSDNDDANNRKKKKEKREKCKQIGEKNKENISSDNQVAWKKISKSTKERQYREKGKRFESRDKDKEPSDKSRDKNKYGEKSKEKNRKKIKDTNDRKKEKRKELPRYDVRKIVAEKPTRPRKDEYGRDIREISRSLSRSRSSVRANKRSHSREPRVSRSFSPRMRSRSRSWSRRLARSWSRNRLSPAHKRSVSRSRRKSPPRDRRSLSRRRSRSILNRRSRRSMSNQRQRRKRSISRKRRTRSRSYSRSRSRSKIRSRTRSRTRSRSRDVRTKDKSKKHKSRSRSKRRKRSRTKSPPPRQATSKSRSKKRAKRKAPPPASNIHSIVMRSRSRSRSRERSYSRDRNRSRNWSKSNEKAGDRGTFAVREGNREQQPVSGQATGWSAQWTPSWSRSRSRTPTSGNRQHEDHLLESRGWSPSSLLGLSAAPASALPPSSPPSQSSAVMASTNVTGIVGSNEPLDGVASPKNLTVILRNKDAIKNKKRKEKRAKERKKSRESERRKTSNKRNRTPPPSKEVFASGDNILVSVCFNNENATGQLNNATTHLADNIPLLTTAKRRHREPIQSESSKKPKKDKSKDKRSKSPKTNKRDKKRKSKAAEIAASKKPVAVIDLDQSPFREQTPSPRDVIVLSDDDQDDDHNNNHHNMNINNNGSNNNNGVGAGNSNNGNPANNNDDNNINQIDNIDDEEDEDEDNGNGDIRILGISTLSEQQMRMTSSAVQQHIQLQLLHQQQAEQQQQQQSGKSQNQEDEKELQQQDQQQLQHKLHLQQRCSLSSDLEQFIAQGPKTPPEPQVKFSISKQPSNLRPASMMHPLFDGDEDEDEEIEGDDDDEDDDDDDDRGNVENDVDDDESNKCLQGTVGEGVRDSSNKITAKDKGDRGENDVGDDADRRDEEEEEDNNEDMDEGDEDDNESQRTEGQKQTIESEGMSKEDHKKLRNTEDSDGGIKIGPNTPPEPPMSPFTSPDAYDPFDPTKSRSPSPSPMDGAMSNDQKHCESVGTSLTSMKDVTSITSNDKADSDKPKVISMLTIKHAISPDKDGSNIVGDSNKLMDNPASKDQMNQCVVSSSNANSFATINPVLATVAAAVQRSGIFSASNPAGFNVQRSLTQANHITTGTQLNKRTGDRAPQLTNLFINSVKNMPISMRGGKPVPNRNSSLLPQNGGEPLETINEPTTIDTSSPYSPGSSLSDGIFDPPSPGRNHHSPSRPPGPSGSNISNIMKNSSGNNSGNTSKNARSTSDKKDAFDALFGSPPIMKTTGTGNKLRMKKPIVKSKKLSNSKIGVRMDENQLQILDDLPSSAVEMQVKDKFLKKLNRQERVVEEVKLVLKPHYTKKHVTKEEYKDIMRKAVPKICHNRTGEINPKKIAQLIEAYVKRCRSNKRKGGSGGIANNAAKPLRPPKNPWS